MLNSQQLRFKKLKMHSALLRVSDVFTIKLDHYSLDKGYRDF